MELTTISEISRSMNISTRTLRYYEQIGLIESIKKDDYAYRSYDENTVRRLQQILVLRKLRIPLKQIALILKSEDVAEVVETFRQNLAELDEEMTALSTIREIINSFITRLNERIHNAALGSVDIKLALLDDTALLEAVDALTVQRIPLKEEKTAADLESASEKLNRLTNREVRIVYLPPSTVVAAHHIGEGCEGVVYGQIAKFINDNNLHELKPDFRAFGFNNPMMKVANTASDGYEAWVTIPDDMEVPPPLVKKQFIGGLYAAHMIPMGAFEEWAWLRDWVMSNDKFVHAWGEVRVTPHDKEMDWAMEEPLNFYNIVKEWYNGADTQQLDLLFPIKPKFAATTKHPQERIVDTFKYNDMSVEVVEWRETIWCGKMEIATNNTDEPDMGRVSDDFLAQDRTEINNRLETAANTLLHFDFETSERPAVAMFAFLVGTESQPAGFDVKKVPAGRYMRLPLTPESAKALGVKPWDGGAPPVEWISERLASQFGYRQVFDLPFIEYYGYLNGSTDKVVNAFLYVPVEKTEKEGDFYAVCSQ
ncbi:MAG: effector binding domain-containing protein [Eubacteriales bacterium]|nr:effector binding domain-containing protein [Eubacteriales bacterium]